MLEGLIELVHKYTTEQWFFVDQKEVRVSPLFMSKELAQQWYRELEQTLCASSKEA